VEIIKPGSKYDFVGKRRWGYITSSILVLISIIVMIKPGIDLGVEFRGGWEIELAFGRQLPVQDLRAALIGSGRPLVSAVEIQQLGELEEGTYLIRGTGEANEQAVLAELQSGVSSLGAPEVLRFESVGARVGSDLLDRGLISLLMALGGILAYVSIRFSWRFAPGAILALLHYVTVATGVITLLGMEFTLPVLAALLALIGFSTNDTIVIYDRVRENLRRRRRPQLTTLFNVSLNEVLGRTIITSGALLVVSLALLIFGGSVLRDFATVLMVGIVAGTYSSIFVASAVTLEIERRWPGPKF
jgi:preprotein translocase subunit SecF